MAPKISIAIPTRNRAHILRDTLTCCLGQTFQDFEVVIAENSDDDSLSRAIVADFNDARIRYFRTGALSMTDNWEFALRNCSGDLLYPIAEKILLHKNTIKDIIKAHNQYNKDIYSFNHAELECIDEKQKSPKWEIIPTETPLAEAFRGNIHLYSQYGLRGYSLIISRKLFFDMYNKYGKVLFPLSIDFTLAFMATFHTDLFCYCSNRYFIYHSKVNSNGASSQYGGKLSSEFLSMHNISCNEAVSHVPISAYTVWNSVLNDFIRVCNAINVKYESEKIGKIEYFKFVYSDLLHVNNFYHIDKSDEFKKCFAYLEDNNIIMDKDILYYLRDNTSCNYKDCKYCYDKISISFAVKLIFKKIIRRLMR